MRIRWEDSEWKFVTTVEMRQAFIRKLLRQSSFHGNKAFPGKTAASSGGKHLLDVVPRELVAGEDGYSSTCSSRPPCSGDSGIGHSSGYPAEPQAKITAGNRYLQRRVASDAA